MDRNKKIKPGQQYSYKTKQTSKKGHKARPIRSLHNAQRKNKPRRHKHCKYICSQHRSTQIHKENLWRTSRKILTATQLQYGIFNNPLSKMDRSSKQNINKDIVALKNALDEMSLTGIHRTFHPKEAKYKLFSNSLGSFSKIDHMMGHKTSLNNFKKMNSY